MVIGEILSVSGAEGRAGVVTDVPTDPTEPTPTDLLDFPPLPQQAGPGRRGTTQGTGFAGGTAPRPPAGPPPGSGPPPAPSEPTSAPAGAALRMVPEAEATARLRIMLPATMPTPSTALRPQAAWEDTHEVDEAPATTPFAQVAASPASPSTLPSQLAAMTTATMVIPLPPSLRPSAGLLTTTLPPDQAAQANAARIGHAFRDTIEEIFGVDLNTVDPAELGLAPRRSDSDDNEDWGSAFSSAGYGGSAGHAARSEAERYADEFATQVFPPIPPAPWAEDAPDLAPTVTFPRVVPSEVFGGAYGVPTQQAPFPVAPNRRAPFGQGADPADPARHSLALRYLGGIFHDSSGGSSFLDPEEVDQGWIPSALGAVPPDAPTEQIARIPAPAPAPVRPQAPAPTPAPAPARVSSAPAPPSPRPRPKPVADPSAPPAPARASSGGAGRARPAGHATRTDRTGSRRKTSTAPATADDRAAGRGRGRALTVAGLCVAALAILYGVALLLSGNVVGGAMPAGTIVAGVQIGGLSPDDARAKLEQDLGPAATKPIALQVGQTPVTLDPAKAGLSFDVDATLDQAGSQRSNPFTIIPALFGVHHELAPVTDVDTTALTAALNTVAASYDTPLVEGKIAFAHGQPVVTVPREGRGFDVPTAITAISSGYLQITGPIELPVSALEPLATPEALQVALEQVARPAVSAPITLDTGGVVTVLTPTQIGDALTIGPNADGVMRPTFDGARLRADLKPAALALEQPGTDAGFALVGGKPQLIPERDGTGFSAQALGTALTGVLTEPAPRKATLQPGPLPPAFTTAQAQALGVTTVLGSATLAVPDAPDRAADTQRAAELAMGSVVQPGAVWSFDKTVGAPTLANGFNETDPSTAKSQGVDLSGGDDMVATAVFNAAFRAGMGDTVHHPNAAYFSRYPVGLDAAVVWPGTDLQWTNAGSHPVYLYVSFAGGQLTAAVLGQPLYDQVSVNVSDRSKVVAPSSSPHADCPTQPASSGFEVNVTRVLLRAGAQVGTEEYHVTYIPFAGTTCDTGNTSSTGSTSGSPSSGTGSSTPTGGGSSAPAAPPSSPSPQPQPSNPGALGGIL